MDNKYRDQIDRENPNLARRLYIDEDDDEDDEFEDPTRPRVRLVGQNGNIFNLVSIAGLALKQVGLINERAEMQKRVMGAGSYDEALQIIMEYVDAY